MRTHRTVVALFEALLLAAGALLLLQAVGAAVATKLFWGVLFLAAASVFWFLFATRRRHRQDCDVTADGPDAEA